jgi:hypothetical protein
MQEIFGVTKPLFLGDAVNVSDLSSLFAKGVIPVDDEDDDGDRDDHDHDRGHDRD